ncbi:hypothetical protein [Pararhizobium sp. IMCC21322]|uniref:hypothetical protein n=1 Tax=Pararhizobium sp. IMCC21322 TaxID=3067903 RepID=UPI00274076B3|nr:hypothetical protein [Pararhizobium sp. IMCC21322]
MNQFPRTIAHHGHEIGFHHNPVIGMLSLKSGDLDLMTELGWVDVAPFSRDGDFVTGTDHPAWL